MNRGRRPGGGTPSGTSGKSSTRAVLVKPRSLATQPPGTSGIPASLRKIWCSPCSVQTLSDFPADFTSCKRWKSRAVARRTEWRAAVLDERASRHVLVCEGVRKAAANQRQSQRAERANAKRRSREAFIPLRARRRRSFNAAYGSGSRNAAAGVICGDAPIPLTRKTVEPLTPSYSSGSIVSQLRPTGDGGPWKPSQMCGAAALLSAAAYGCDP